MVCGPEQGQCAPEGFGQCLELFGAGAVDALASEGFVSGEQCAAGVENHAVVVGIGLAVEGECGLAECADALRVHEPTEPSEPQRNTHGFSGCWSVVEPVGVEPHGSVWVSGEDVCVPEDHMTWVVWIGGIGLDDSEVALGPACGVGRCVAFEAAALVFMADVVQG